jgi:hypothetical protein
VPRKESFGNVIDLPSSECEVITNNPNEFLMNILIYMAIYDNKKVNGSVPV